ncbi:ACP S-malonyltransferase [Labedella endophytica]|uniref:[acyl-carrier-protein] S-malonyltransferase n=1 Tax=Labedella endophytica TaxID=1523160 RepID=A0A433JR37_9MICO|nr:ACP S-malonyltransferase [Labedella endophytica]RUR00798.1 ACP S-malonyltransferase [Labedella endophytica]
MIILACPGQGSQTPGFLTPWLDVDGVRELLAGFSDAAGIDIVAHGTTSDADTIRDTAIAQPLIVAAGLVTAHALAARGALAGVGGIAGHSVGEFTAAAVAGVVDDVTALRLVRTRADAMAGAASTEKTGMSAVLGGEPAAVVAAAEAAGLSAANYNGGGQIVVAGRAEDLASFSAAPPAGTRVIALQVAGAFHTRFMEDARAELASAVSGVTANSPTLPLWTNNDGSRVEDGSRFLDLLVTQVAAPVRWDACMTAFADAGATGLIEVAPAGALTGLARRGLKGLPTVAIKTPDDLQAAVDLIAA